jgi:hypothetical protein
MPKPESSWNLDIQALLTRAADVAGVARVSECRV